MNEDVEMCANHLKHPTTIFPIVRDLSARPIFGYKIAKIVQNANKK